ncbi:MAG: hypothetical protein HUU02_12570 [Bacteroidetes bacterium]|nr:hypothetical protein [Bacteroidota bacterium]
MNDGTFDGVVCHQRGCPPQAGKSERDSSRALHFARGSFASFLAPSRKEEKENDLKIHNDVECDFLKETL